MALHDDDELEEKSGTGIPPTYDTKKEDFTSSLSFTGSELKLMNANKASEFTNSIASEISKIYKNNNARDTRVYVLDKEIITKLAYSYIIVAKNTKKAVYYFVVTLEGTGRKPLTAKETNDEYKQAIKTGQGGDRLYTTDCAINIYLKEVIVEILARDFGNELPFVCGDGMTLPYKFDNIEQASLVSGAIAYNALKVIQTLEDNVNADLNIAKGNRDTKNAALRIDTSINRATIYNEVGSPIRADWRLDLSVKANDNTGFSAVNELNKENTSATIVKVAGYVDAIPDEKVTPVPTGHPIREIRMHPHIIVTSIGVSKPTIGFMLLGIATSMLMTNEGMWMGNLLPDKSKYNVGALNQLTNLENNTNGIGNKLNLEGTGKAKMSDQEVGTIVSSMFELSPIVSVDIEAYGPQTFYTSVLSAAAAGLNNSNTIGALKTIIETAHTLTNGHFPKEFPTDQIFNHEGVLIPLGTWKDKTGADRDIREIDLTMVASETESIEMMNAWAFSNLPTRITNADPYMTKIDIISQLIPNAEITSKAVRVTFTSAFINKLIESCILAGFNVRYDGPDVRPFKANNMSIMSGFLNNAGLSDVSRFARTSGFSGPTYNTSWTTSGLGRF